MKTKLAGLVGAIGILVSVYATPLMAISIGVGASFSASHLEIDGQEKLRGDANSSAVTQKAKEDAQAALASVHAQIIVGEGMFGEGNGFTLGVEHFFGEASFKGRTEQETDIADAVGGISMGTQYAEAVLKDLNTVFIETPGFTPLGIYLKAGWSELDVITKEDLMTGGTYGDTSADGAQWGIGFKKSAGGLQSKIEFNYTDWDTISVNNTSDSTGTSTVSGTPEQWGGKISIGYNF